MKPDMTGLKMSLTVTLSKHQMALSTTMTMWKVTLLTFYTKYIYTDINVYKNRY